MHTHRESAHTRSVSKRQTDCQTNREAERMTVSISTSWDMELVKALAFYAAIVLLKTMLMSVATSFNRFRKNVFANPEDKPTKDAKIKFDDPDVERVRRCHLNDMENVYTFVMVGLLYCLIKPSHGVAIWHFRVFTVSRLLHTIAYVGQIPQPARALCFMFGYVASISMAVQVILHFCC